MTTDASSPQNRPLRSYGRIKSRAIKPRQAALMDSLLPRLALDLSGGKLDPMALMPAARAVWLEIGFGGGEHLASQAARHPDTLLLGAEPFLNGSASALRHIDEQDIGNVRLHAGDARDVVAALPDASLDRIFILFPDPWPKARHNKRRIVQTQTIQDFRRVLKPGGTIRFATDVQSYADWTLERFNAATGLERSGNPDWSVQPEDHVVTRYQTKKLGDIDPVFMDFAKI